MAVGLVEHGESYDLAMFADTGGERPDTYAYLSVLNEYVRAHNFPPIMTVWKKNPDETRAKTLEQDCLDRKALPSLAYGFKSCSDHYKIRPQRAVLNRWKPALDAWAEGRSITMLVGFDIHEAHRRLKSFDTDKIVVRYPLVEWGWGREECIEHIKAAGLPVPGKSSCFFCPSMRKAEIMALQPDLLARAIALEQNADLTDLVGLGRSFSWSNLVKQPSLPFLETIEPICACID
jgi:hypothetical protein